MAASDLEFWTCDRIRLVRGGLTREQFAARLGVTPLTVYRWELPDDAPQARRPRGKVAARLSEYAAAQRPVVTSSRADAPEGALPGAALAPLGRAELARLEPILEHLTQGDFARVQDELLALFGSGALRSVAGRALAAQALARCQLFSRGDALSACATLVPLLQLVQDGALPEQVALEVHVTAALLYSSFDGRLFDAGKTNAHVAAAEALMTADSDAQRIFAWSAQVLAAYMLNDPGLLEHVLARSAEMPSGERSPLLRSLLLQTRLIRHYFAKAPDRAAPAFQEYVELTAAHRFPLLHVRALVQAARDQADEGAPPEAVLALTSRANELCRTEGLATGLHLLYGAYAEAEALFRSGQIAAAERVLGEGMGFAAELRWAWGSLPFFLLRSMLLTGRVAAIDAVLARATACESPLLADVLQGLKNSLSALAELIRAEAPSARMRALKRLEHEVHELSAQAWPFARRSMAITYLAASVYAGEPEDAERALRVAELTLREVPAAWARTAVTALTGAFELRRGRYRRARGSLEDALAGFERAKDRVSSALVRRLLALIASDLRDVDAEAQLAASATEFEALGLKPPPGFELRPAPGEELELQSSDEGRALGRFARAVQSLCLSDAHARTRRLFEAALAIRPDALVLLERRDAAHRSHTLHASRPLPAEGVTFAWAELELGGERLRIGVETRAGESRVELEDALVALAAVASLSATREARVASAPVHEAAEAAVPDDLPELPGLIAASAGMRRLKQDIARLARSRATILIQGESGSGKEVVARALHDLSVRAARPYVAFNCAAIPRELFEGQLFGYRRGAFTGASADHAGVIRAALGGTLFLDEIAELPLDLQPKLLRFLENGEVLPLGETRPLHVDVRVIAASYRDLSAMVREGKFREDLYYRLQVVPLRVPPLRERPEDVVALARHFITKLTPEGEQPPILASDALRALTTYPWPGNVRELRNVLERTLAFESGKAVLGASDLRLR